MMVSPNGFTRLRFSRLRNSDCLCWPKAKAHRNLGQSAASAQECVKQSDYWPKAIIIREPLRFEYGFQPMRIARFNNPGATLRSAPGYDNNGLRPTIATETPQLLTLRLGLLLFLWLSLATGGKAREPKLAGSYPLIRIAAPLADAALLKASGNGSFEFKLAPSDEKLNAEAPTKKDAEEISLVGVEELVAWGNPAELRSEVVLLTTDGSLLVGGPAAFGGDIAALKGASLTFVTGLFDEIILPLAAVRGIVFQPPADARGKDRLLARMAKIGGTEDLVVLANGDELTGTIRSFAEGKLKLLRRGTAGPGEIELTLSTPSGSGQVAAIAFNPAPGAAKAKPTSRLLVGFADGSLVAADKLWRDADEVRLQMPGPNKTTLVCDRPTKLVSLQPLNVGVTYLSDLTAHSYRHIPYLTLTLPYYIDRSATGDRLRSNGKLYSKGLGIPSAARLTYVLDKPYRRFQAELALDDAAEMQGSVVCRVYLNIDGAWKPAYESEIIRGGDWPVPISVDLKGAAALTLIVDYADRGDEQDLANWLNARLVE
jgi:hypothetical protein